MSVRRARQGAPGSARAPAPGQPAGAAQGGARFLGRQAPGGHHGPASSMRSGQPASVCAPVRAPACTAASGALHASGLQPYFCGCLGFLGTLAGERQRSIAEAVKSGANGVVYRKCCRDPQRMNFCVGGDRRSTHPPPVHAGAAAIGLSPVSVIACIAARAACVRLVSEVPGVSSMASCFCQPGDPLSGESLSL